MSYQPNPPYDPGMMTPVAQPSAAPSRRRSWLGPLLIVAGLLGATATYLAQQVNYRKRIDNLERAVSGYTTTLTFEKPGTFSLYYEYAGTFNASFDGQEEKITIESSENLPDFSASLKDEEGGSVELNREVPALAYDVSGFKGRSFAQAVIDRPGDYTLEVVPATATDEFDLAIGIGEARKPSIALPLVVALVGVVPGLLLVLLGGRKKAPGAQMPSQVLTPGMYAPSPASPQQPPGGYGPSPLPGPPAAPPMSPIPGQPSTPGQSSTPGPPSTPGQSTIPTPTPLPPPVWGPPQV